MKMESVANFIIRYRKLILALSVVVSAGAGALLTQLKVDTDFTNYISPTDPVIMQLKEVGSAFGSNYTAIVLVESGDSFAPEIMQGIDRLTRAYQDHPGVASVVSLTNVVDIKKTDLGLEVSDLVPDEAVLSDPAALADLRRYALGKPAYANFLVSPDGRFTALYVNIAENARKDVVASELRDLTETMWPAETRSAQISFAGEPMLLNYLNHIIVRDMAVLVPLVIMLLVGILYCSFRTLRGVVLPLAAVAVATVVTFGIMALTRTPLTIIAAIMPVVLLSNGSAYGIHMLNFISLNSDRASDSAGAVRIALRQVAVPILLSAVTTFIGFMSFVMSVLTIFRTFGLFTAIGIAAALVFALTFVPATVCCLKLPRAIAGSGGGGATAASFLNRPLTLMAHALHDHRRAVLAAAALVTLALVPGIFRLHSDFDLLGFFSQESEPRQADAVMTEEFGGTVAYMVHLKGPVRDPLALGEIYRLHKHLRQALCSPLVNSIADVIAEMNDSLNGQRAIPATRAGVESLYLLMEGKDQLNRLVTPAADQTLITARLPQMSSAVTDRNVAAVDLLIQEKLRLQLVALPFEAVPRDRLPELGALVAGELLDDLAADLASAGRTLTDRDRLRSLLQAAVGAPADADALSADDRRRSIAGYLAAADCDLLIEEQAVRDALAEALAALAEPTADAIERQIRETAPALAGDAEGVELAAASIVRLLAEEATRREHERLLGAILAASAPAGEASGALASELRGELGRLSAGYWPVTPEQYAGLTGQPPPAASVVSMTAAQTGPPLVYGTIVERLSQSQINSLVLCLALVMIVMVIQLRSLKRGLIAMVPIVFTLAVNFGLMGYLGVTLNLATALIASLAIGIGIDYTIHTAYRIRIEAGQGGTLYGVLERVFLSTGRAVLINALAVIAGFVVIVASELNIIKQFGGLSALSIGIAAGSALTIYPVLVMTFDRRYIAPSAPAPGPTSQLHRAGDHPADGRAARRRRRRAGDSGTKPDIQPSPGGTP
ncbi:MAG: MMPL family transporter [Deltaproteobacteria bacterium]|nr:MMPL family transporter [Deltaproteobacteria bacterium]